MEIAGFAQAVKANVGRVIVGKDAVTELLLVTLLVEGHALLEDVPGIGKTTLAKALSRCLALSFARIQFTPDLLPSDVTGINYYNQKRQEFEFRAGPAFSQLLLADEINRATPRTQSALLEAMAERQVTVDGTTYAMERPFMVIATQNPIEHEGTFPLPEAQLDRFLIRMSVGYPSFPDENAMLERLRLEHPIHSLQQVADADELRAAQAVVREVFIHEKVREYIVRISQATRRSPDLAMGASPRATLALYRTSQALAAIEGRKYVLPDDVKYCAEPVFCHRVILNPESRLRGRTSIEAVEAVLETIPAPVERTSA